MKLTRRNLAAALVSAHCRRCRSNRNRAASAGRRSARPPATACKANGAALAAVAIPMATEPAFQFKA